MVKRITSKNNDNDVSMLGLTLDFKDDNGFDVFDYMLVHDSECRNYEHLYVFLNDMQINSFINICNQSGLDIIESVDFTKEVLDMVINNKLDEFKSNFETTDNFDQVIDYFYRNSVSKDDVLDKIIVNGIKSLNERDYNTLGE